MTELQAVVVAYRAEDQLHRSLSALSGEVDVTVVDNSSSPAVRDVATRHGARYLDTGENLGFGAGVNVALRRFSAMPPRAVLLLNPDAVLEPSATRAMTEFLQRPGHERVAAVSPQLLDESGLEQRVMWPFPNPGRAWAEAVGLALPTRRAFAVGAVLMLRWEAIGEVGLFDERFFLYAEETDWQRRASSLGWTSELCVEAVAEHRGAGTSDDPRRREILFHAAQETYIRKWYGRTGWWMYRSAVCLGAAGRALVLGGERRADAIRRARLYLRGPRRTASLAEE